MNDVFCVDIDNWSRLVVESRQYRWDAWYKHNARINNIDHGRQVIESMKNFDKQGTSHYEYRLIRETANGDVVIE